MIEICNAVISEAVITNADHGCLTAWLKLDFGGSSQGFGGYNLYAPDSSKMMEKNYAGYFIWRVLEAVGVSEWSKLAGKPIRVKREEGQCISAIGHIIEDRWFCPGVEMKKLEDLSPKIIDPSIKNSDLWYDAKPGDNLAIAAEKVFKFGLAGFFFNDTMARRDIDTNTPNDLIDVWHRNRSQKGER